MIKNDDRPSYHSPVDTNIEIIERVFFDHISSPPLGRKDQRLLTYHDDVYSQSELFFCLKKSSQGPLQLQYELLNHTNCVSSSSFSHKKAEKSRPTTQYFLHLYCTKNIFYI
jgi:hypothetical protein